jgi:hypothetical protein
MERCWASAWHRSKAWSNSEGKPTSQDKHCSFSLQLLAFWEVEVPGYVILYIKFVSLSILSEQRVHYDRRQLSQIAV